RDRRSLVAVARKRAAGPVENLLPAGLEMLFGDLRHPCTLQNRTYVLYYWAKMGLLRNRNLAAVLTAEFVSLTGSAMTYVALPWFVLTTTGSTAKMGWVLAAELLPVGLLGIPAGSLIARLGAKRTMNLADAARAPLMAAVPVLYWTDHLSFPLLLAFTFAIGCFMAPYYASSRLILPEVVGEDEQLVAQGSAFVQAITQLTQLGGPILGGLLISLTSAPAVLIVDAATYAFSFVVIFTFVRVGKRVEQDESSRGLFAGLRHVWHDQLLRPMLCAASFINFTAQGWFATIPVLVLRRYDAEPKILGFFFAAFGAGALVGSLVAANLVRKVPLLRLPGVALPRMAPPPRVLAIRMPSRWGCPCPSGSWRSACRGRSCSSCSRRSVSARRSSTRPCSPSSRCAPPRRS